MKHPSAAVRRAAVLAVPPGCVRAWSSRTTFDDADPAVVLRGARDSELEPNETAGKRAAVVYAPPSSTTAGCRTPWRRRPRPTTCFVLKEIASKKLRRSACGRRRSANTCAGPQTRGSITCRRARSADLKTAETIVAALAKGWPKGKSRLTRRPRSAGGLLEKFPDRGKGNLVKLAAARAAPRSRSTGRDREVPHGHPGMTRRRTTPASRAKQLTEFRPADPAAAEASPTRSAADRPPGHRLIESPPAAPPSRSAPDCEAGTPPGRRRAWLGGVAGSTRSARIDPGPARRRREGRFRPGTESRPEAGPRRSPEPRIARSEPGRCRQWRRRTRTGRR